MLLKEDVDKYLSKLYPNKKYFPGVREGSVKVEKITLSNYLLYKSVANNVLCITPIITEKRYFKKPHTLKNYTRLYNYRNKGMFIKTNSSILHVLYSLIYDCNITNNNIVIIEDCIFSYKGEALNTSWFDKIKYFKDLPYYINVDTLLNLADTIKTNLKAVHSLSAFSNEVVSLLAWLRIEDKAYLIRNLIKYEFYNVSSYYAKAVIITTRDTFLDLQYHALEKEIAPDFLIFKDYEKILPTSLFTVSNSLCEKADALKNAVEVYKNKSTILELTEYIEENVVLPTFEEESTFLLNESTYVEIPKFTVSLIAPTIVEPVVPVMPPTATEAQQLALEFIAITQSTAVVISDDIYEGLSF